MSDGRLPSGAGHTNNGRPGLFCKLRKECCRHIHRDSRLLRLFYIYRIEWNAGGLEYEIWFLLSASGGEILEFVFTQRISNVFVLL